MAYPPNHDRQNIKLIVTNVEGKDKCINVWVQMDLELVRRIDERLHHIQGDLERTAGFLHISQLPANLYCCAKSSLFRKWCRAQVLSIPLKDVTQVAVFFIDYGIIELVSVGDISKADESLFTMPRAAVSCILADVVPADRMSWSAEAILFCEKNLKFQEVIGSFIGKRDGVMVLRIAKVGATSPFSQLLVNKGYALPLSVPPTLVYNGQTYLALHLDVKREYVVYVSHVESPKKFYIQLQSTEVDLNTLMEAIDVYVNNHDIQFVENVLPGTPCLTKFSEDRTYYRAVVTAVRGKDCNVMFVDYGNSEVKQCSELIIIPLQLLSLPAQAVECTLQGGDNLDVQTFHAATDGKLLTCLVVDHQAPKYTVVLSSEGSHVAFKGTPPAVQSPNYPSFKLLHLPFESTSDVFVISIHSPLKFFCQLTKSRPHLTSLMNTLSLNSHQLNSGVNCLHIKECNPGRPVCVRSDGHWYRAEIISVEGSNVEVWFVDYGISQVTILENVRRLNPEMQELAIQALKFSLFGFEDISRELLGSHKVVSKFEELALEKNVVAQVKASNPDGSYKVMLYSVEARSQICINDELKKMLTVIDMNNIFPKPTKIENICITSFVSPFDFFGQLTKFPLKELEGLQMKLNEYYYNSIYGYQPQISEVVCAKFSEDNQFYRGKVTAVNGNKYSITFLDYGGCEDVGPLNIRKLEPEFITLPAQGIKCAFSHCPSSVPVEKLRDLMLDNTLQVEICGESDGVWSVTLTETFAGNAPILEFIRQHGTEMSSCSLQQPIIDIGSKELVVVTDVSSGYLWCQLQKNISKLEALMEKMNLWYNRMNSQDKLLPPAIQGTFCVSKYSADEGWYRALILGFDPPGKMEIRFVDYGNRELVGVHDAKVLRPEFSELPEQAVRCVIDGSKYFSEYATNFKDLIDKEFTALFKGYDTIQQAYLTELIDNSGNSLSKVFRQQAAEQSEWTEPLSKNSQQTKIENWNSNSVTKRSNQSPYVKENRYNDSNSNYQRSKSPFQEKQYTKTYTSPGRPSDHENSIQKTRKKASDFFDSSSETELGKNNGNNVWRNEKSNRDFHSSQHKDNSSSHEDLNEKQMSYKNNEAKQKQFGPKIKINSPVHKISSSSDRMSYEYLSLPDNAYRDVAVVHLISPSEFYCHLVENNSQILTLMEEINDTYTNLRSNELLINDPVVGSPCCAIFSEDNAWYRGKILNVSGSIIEVQYVDYGNIEKMQLSNIRTLKSNFFSLPLQAIKCSLYNILPQGQSWNAEDIGRFEEMTKDKCLVAQFLKKHSDGTFHINLINVDKLQDGILNKEFVDTSSGNSAKASKNLFYDSHTISAHITLADPVIANGDKEKVTITWVLNYCEFYCQLQSSTSQFQKMMQDMQSHYSSLEEMKDVIEIPQVGMVCAAQFKDDNCWYRAHIVHMKGSLVGVHYVDYGNSEDITRKRVRYLLPQFTHLPIQSIRCRIKGIKSPEENISNLIDENIVKKYFTDEVKCTFLASYDNCFLVDVEANGKDVALQMIELNLVVPDSKAPSVASGGSQGSISQFSSKSGNIKQCISPMKLEVKTGEYLDVSISHIENPAIFWCQLQSGRSQLEELMTLLEAHYSKLPENEQKLTNPTNGTACVAKFSEDDCWYRAVVQSRPSPSKLDVKFIDYGNSEVIHHSRAKAILPEQTVLPAQAFKCCLFGLSDDVSTDELEDFQKLVEKELVAKIENMKDNVVFVTLFDTSSGVELNVGKQIFGFLEFNDKGETSTDDVGHHTADYPSFPPVIIPEGKHPAYVSHLISWKEFFIQLINSENDLNNISSLLEEIYNANSKLEVPVDIRLGLACCTKFSEDQTWYRGEVICIEGDQITVRFVDYGNSETVERKQILSLDPEFLVQPPFAILCQLDMNLPVQSTSEQNNITNIIFGGFEEKTYAVTFDGKTLPAVVLLEDDSGDVRQLISEVIPPPSLPHTQHSVQKYSSIKVPESEFEATISFVESIEKFYVNLVSMNDKLSSLGAELNEFYGKISDNDYVITDATLSQPCAAKFSEDGCWYRTVITEIEDDLVTVHFVDYGNSEVYQMSALKVIASHFLEESPMALECSLFGVEVADEKEEAILQFEAITDGSLLLVPCDKQIPLKVHLMKDDINIAEQLIESGLFKSTMPVIKEKLHIPSVESVPSVKHSLPIGKTTVEISHVESFDKFYVIPCSISDELQNLHIKLQESYNCYEDGTGLEKRLLSSDIKLSYLYAAQSSEDEQWYRGLVTAVNGDTITVFLIDYGNTLDINKSYLAELSAEFTTQLPFAMPYTIYGVNVVEECSALVKDRLSEFVDGKVCVVGVFSAEAPHYEKIICDKIDIIEQLLQEGLVTVAIPASDVESSIGDEIKSFFEEKEIYKYPQRSVVNGEVSATISHVHISESIYIYMIPTDLKEKYNKLQSAMQEAYQNSAYNSSTRLTEIYVSQLCAVNQNGDWHRASVSHITREVITVKLIDIGSVEAVAGSALKSLLPELVNDDPYAIWCVLNGVTLVKEKNEDVEQWLQQLICSKEVFVNIFGRQGDSNASPYMVKLTVDGKDVVEQLTEDELLAKHPLVDQYSYQILEMSIGDRIEVLISHVLSPSEFWIHISDYQNDLTKLMDEIDKLYSSLTLDEYCISCWSSKQPCIALYSDHQWCRGEIKTVNENSATVRFVDYGNEEEVSKSFVKRIDSELVKKLPAQAIKCSLFDVIPLSGSEWDLTEVDKFEEVADIGQKIFLAECKEKSGDTYSVTLLDMGINVGKQYIEQGYALSSALLAKTVNDPLWKELNSASVTTEYISELTGNGDEFQENFSSLPQVLESSTETMHTENILTQENSCLKGKENDAAFAGLQPIRLDSLMMTNEKEKYLHIDSVHSFDDMVEEEHNNEAYPVSLSTHDLDEDNSLPSELIPPLDMQEDYTSDKINISSVPADDSHTSVVNNLPTTNTVHETIQNNSILSVDRNVAKEWEEEPEIFDNEEKYCYEEEFYTPPGERSTETYMEFPATFNEAQENLTTLKLSDKSAEELELKILEITDESEQSNFDIPFVEESTVSEVCIESTVSSIDSHLEKVNTDNLVYVVSEAYDKIENRDEKYWNDDDDCSGPVKDPSEADNLPGEQLEAPEQANEYECTEDREEGFSESVTKDRQLDALEQAGGCIEDWEEEFSESFNRQKDALEQANGCTEEGKEEISEPFVKDKQLDALEQADEYTEDWEGFSESDAAKDKQLDVLEQADGYTKDWKEEFSESVDKDRCHISLEESTLHPFISSNNIVDAISMFSNPETNFNENQTQLQHTECSTESLIDSDHEKSFSKHVSGSDVHESASESFSITKQDEDSKLNSEIAGKNYSQNNLLDDKQFPIKSAAEISSALLATVSVVDYLHLETLDSQELDNQQVTSDCVNNGAIANSCPTVKSKEDKLVHSHTVDTLNEELLTAADGLEEANFISSESHEPITLEYDDSCPNHFNEGEDASSEQIAEFEDNCLKQFLECESLSAHKDSLSKQLAKSENTSLKQFSEYEDSFPKQLPESKDNSSEQFVECEGISSEHFTDHEQSFSKQVSVSDVPESASIENNSTENSATLISDHCKGMAVLETDTQELVQRVDNEMRKSTAVQDFESMKCFPPGHTTHVTLTSEIKSYVSIPEGNSFPPSKT